MYYLVDVQAMDDREMRSNASFDFTGMGDAVEYMPGFNRCVFRIRCSQVCRTPLSSRMSSPSHGLMLRSDGSPGGSKTDQSGSAPSPKDGSSPRGGPGGAPSPSSVGRTPSLSRHAQPSPVGAPGGGK